MLPNPELIFVCEICQTILEAHHCKAICPNCGRMLDCSDLPAMAANASYDAATHDLVLRPGSDPRDWLPSSAPEIKKEAVSDPTSVRDLP